MKARLSILVILVASSVIYVPSVALAEGMEAKVFWTNHYNGTIQKANLNGSNVETVVTASQPLHIAVDPGTGMIYWIDAGTAKIRRATAGGMDIQAVIALSGYGDEVGIAVDAIGQKVYWTRYEAGIICRANLDGTGREELVTSLGGVNSIAIDGAGGKMYWTNRYDDMIQRANLDGSAIEKLYSTGLVWPCDIDLDVPAGNVYWCDDATGSIWRADLDGGNADIIVTGLLGVEGIALDLLGRKIYWTNDHYGKIQRANLDGTMVEDIATGQGYQEIFGIAVVPEPATLSMLALGGLAMLKRRRR